MRDPVKLAWCAGFYDGEGSTSLANHKKGKRPILRMSVGQIDKETLDRLVDGTGVGRIYGPYQSDRDRAYNKKPVYRWITISEEDTWAAINLLWPYLSTQKRTQIWEKAAQAYPSLD